MLNYWIGYGDKPLLKGIFKKKRKEVQSSLPDALQEEAESLGEREIAPGPLCEEVNEDKPSKSKTNKTASDIKKYTGNAKKLAHNSEKLADEILKQFTLAEKIEENKQSGIDNFVDDFNQEGCNVFKEKQIERLIKYYISVSLRDGKSEEEIKEHACEFLKRYVLLKIKNIKEIKRIYRMPDLNIRSIRRNLLTGIEKSDRMTNLKKIAPLHFIDKDKTIFWVHSCSQKRFQIYKNRQKLGPVFFADKIIMIKIENQKAWAIVEKNRKCEIYCNGISQSRKYDEIRDLEIVKGRAWYTSATYNTPQISDQWLRWYRSAEMRSKYAKERKGLQCGDENTDCTRSDQR